METISTNQLTPEQVKPDGSVVINLFSSKVIWTLKTKSGYKITLTNHWSISLTLLMSLQTSIPYRASMTPHHRVLLQASLAVLKITQTAGVSWFHEVQRPLMPCMPLLIDIFSNSRKTGVVRELRIQAIGIRNNTTPILTYLAQGVVDNT